MFKLNNLCFLIFAIVLGGCSNSPEDLIVKISRGDQHALDEYIQKGFDVNKPFAGASLIFNILMADKYNMVDTVLKHGANPNSQNSYSATVLMEASAIAKPSIVQLLIAHQADVAKTDESGDNAVWYAVGGNPENIYLLVSAGGNVNNPDKNGETPLIKAVIYRENSGRGYVAIMTLLSLGANVDCTNSDGSTPLSIAEEHHDTNVVNLLFKYSGVK